MNSRTQFDYVVANFCGVPIGGKWSTLNPPAPAPRPSQTWLRTQTPVTLTRQTPAISNSNKQDDDLDSVLGKKGESGGIRVGRDYQAKIPEFIPKEDRNLRAVNDKSLLVWRPTDTPSDDEIKEYVKMAKSKQIYPFRYTEEQALGLLYWHQFNLQKAKADLVNFEPHPDEWSFDEKVLFEQALEFHGKCFQKIRLMLPDKSVYSLVRYYYDQKKKRVFRRGPAGQGAQNGNGFHIQEMM